MACGIGMVLAVVGWVECLTSSIFSQFCETVVLESGLCLTGHGTIEK